MCWIVTAAARPATSMASTIDRMRVLIGLSGGVDSSFAAHSLLQDGHQTEGAVLQMHEYTDTASAQAVAEKLGIVCHVIDCRERFAESVQRYFMDEYERGRTPNPCVFCNRQVKFALLASYAKEHGFDRIATGHYARIGQENGRFYIEKNDSPKDQSYMLSRLTQDQLAMLVFPLGETQEKDEIRRLAAEAALPTAHKADSQEICFIPDNDYAAFIEARRGPCTKGHFVDAEGRVLGEHKGILHYTVGQRKGLGIALGRPHYVTDIDPQNGNVTLSPEDAYAEGFQAVDPVYQLADHDRPIEQERFDVKIRYAARPVPVTVSVKGGVIHARFDAPQRAVTPGQNAVFYRDGKVALCGWIDRAGSE